MNALLNITYPSSCFSSQWGVKGGRRNVQAVLHGILHHWPTANCWIFASNGKLFWHRWNFDFGQSCPSSFTELFMQCVWNRRNGWGKWSPWWEPSVGRSNLPNSESEQSSLQRKYCQKQVNTFSCFKTFCWNSKSHLFIALGMSALYGQHRPYILDKRLQTIMAIISRLNLR